MNLPKPTESELEILHVLWQHGPSTVRHINEQINLVKETGYTTTLKMCQIMHEKELVGRDISTKQHIYHAAITEHATQKNLLNRFIDATFQGNAMSMVMQALGNHEASADELEQIKALITEIEKHKN
jgi:BlaI family transcriptional regulator, penicillinase repressor